MRKFLSLFVVMCILAAVPAASRNPLAESRRSSADLFLYKLTQKDARFLDLRRIL